MTTNTNSIELYKTSIKELKEFIMNSLRENEDITVNETWKLNYFLGKFNNIDLEVLYKGNFESVILQIQKLFKIDFVGVNLIEFFHSIISGFIDDCTDENGVLDETKLNIMKQNITRHNIMEKFKKSLTEECDAFWLIKTQ